MNAFDRVISLIGKDKFNIIKNSSVALFGVGGVGGFVAEALVRSGIGKLTVFDADVVSKSNINRQIIADENSVGRDKVAVIKERLLAINPQAEIITHKVFYLPSNSNEYSFSSYDYVIDAVDTVSAKIEIISQAKNANVPVISCMGTAGKLDQSAIKVCDVSKTSGCPLARVMRRELRARGITGVKVVYSTEGVSACATSVAEGQKTPPSMIFVPAVAGLTIAKEVIFDLIESKEK